MTFRPIEQTWPGRSEAKFRFVLPVLRFPDYAALRPGYVLSFEAGTRFGKPAFSERLIAAIFRA